MMEHLAVFEVVDGIRCGSVHSGDKAGVIAKAVSSMPRPRDYKAIPKRGVFLIGYQGADSFADAVRIAVDYQTNPIYTPRLAS